MPSPLKPTLRGAGLARALSKLVRIYWVSPDAKWGALLLTGAIGLEFLTVRASVLVSEAQRRVGDALELKDAAAFASAVGLFVAFALLFVVVSTYRVYLRQALEIRWRRGLTGYFVGRWIGIQAYGQSQLHGHEVDNPDQRIAEDVRDFVASALGLSLSLLSAIVTLYSFGGLLWGMSRDWLIPIAGVPRPIPGFLLWVAVAFALLSMWLTHLMGRRLVPINFDKFRFEADFRYGLVRFRERAEEVALSRGEAVERLGALERFRRVFENWGQLIGAERNLSLLTGALGRSNSLVPIVVAAPAYFAGLLSLGAILQTRVAYDQVSGALSWFVNGYREIARWRANVERLSAFSDVMDATARDLARAGIELVPSADAALRIEDLRIDAPPGRVIVEGANARLDPGERVALLGRSGAGKTTLFRTLAGLWPFGAGRIERPPRERMVFVPQRPYLPLGTLRAVVTYPAAEGSVPDERIREVLELLELGDLTRRLDEVEPWDQRLSVHEQQRLGIARVLLLEPDWILLDEATSALDEAMEERVYGLLVKHLPGAALLSAAVRPSAVRHLAAQWTLAERGGRSVLQAA
ncbi:MAG TPA: ABC transporter ATP-binding protein/permease [Myxococcota bacterium]|nr:ABC transporter ATP-binding protein/permease [Myxococcota bacterium]